MRKFLRFLRFNWQTSLTERRVKRPATKALGDYALSGARRYDIFIEGTVGAQVELPDRHALRIKTT